MEILDICIAIYFALSARSPFTRFLLLLLPRLLTLSTSLFFFFILVAQTRRPHIYALYRSRSHYIHIPRRLPTKISSSIIILHYKERTKIFLSINKP